MRNSKAECLDEIRVILELMSEYELRLKDLAKRYSEKKAELAEYENTEKIIAINEPDVEQKKETILTGKV